MLLSEEKVELLALRPVRAGAPNTLLFTLTCGERPIGPGGGMEIVFRSDKTEVSWTPPQSADPTAPGYVTARGESGVELRLIVNPMPPFAEEFSFRFHVISCYLTAGELRPGQKLTVTYGDTTGGSYGALAPVTALPSRFPVLVYHSARQRVSEFYSRQYRAMGARARHCYQNADHLVGLDIQAGSSARLSAIVPSLLRSGSPASLRVVALDSYANPAPYETASADVLLLDQDRRIRRGLGTIGLKRGRGTLRFAPPKPGVHYLRVEDRHSGLWGVSNPFLTARTSMEDFFWGDPHCHSQLSDGVASSEEHYRYARDVALLDFAAVTDHGPRSPQVWEETCRWADRFSRAGRFVTLLGHERTLTDNVGGTCYVNYYYLTRDSLADVPEPLSGGKSPELLAGLRARRGIIVPHHTAYAIDHMGLSDWGLFTDVPVFTCEVYSTHGNAESFAGPRRILGRRPGTYYQDALARGFRLGAIAGSDHHGVQCGSLLRLQDFPKNSTDAHMALRGGLTAARAVRLTRADLFAAMASRRTYASTGDRILLDFSVSGCPMGAIAQWPRVGPRRLELVVAGTAPLAQVEVLKNNEVLASFTPGTFILRTAVTDKKAGQGPLEWYYLRIRQADGEMAWSSPVWFEGKGSAGLPQSRQLSETEGMIGKGAGDGSSRCHPQPS